MRPFSFRSSKGLLWRRLIVTVPILIITVYDVIDITMQHRGLFLKVLDSVVTGEVARGNDAPPSMSQMVDIISVGSLLKESYQAAQQRTFGSHSAVRNFFRVTEMSDTDRECFSELTTDQLQEIIDFCSVSKGEVLTNAGTKQQKQESFISTLFRDVLFHPRKHAGWMCAQKRPIDGLFHVLKQYRDGMEIPQYLFIIDDDTYVNMDSVTDILLKEFPAETPHLVTGCNFEFLSKASITFPYGGFGSFLTKASIKRLLQPIDCNTRDANNSLVADPFSQLACWRLNSDFMGEKRFFEDGMSVSDLMFRFASEQPFADVAKWKSGYCFHSDHALAYFMNFYHIAVPDYEMKEDFTPNDEFRGKYKFTALTNEQGQGRRGECSNERERCKLHNHVCHYIQPDQMDDLYLEKQQQDAKEAADEIRVKEAMENEGNRFRS